MTLLESGGGFTALSQRLAMKIASIASAWTFDTALWATDETWGGSP